MTRSDATPPLLLRSPSGLDSCLAFFEYLTDFRLGSVADIRPAIEFGRLGASHSQECNELPRRVVQSAADNGVATASSGLRSAATPKRNAISAAASIRAAPKRYPPKRLTRELVSIRAPKSHGAPTPPI